MANIISPNDILAGDRKPLDAPRRLSPLSHRMAQGAHPRLIDRNQLEICAVLADGRTHSLRCIEVAPEAAEFNITDRTIVAYTEPGELSGELARIAVHVRGRPHQEIEHSVLLGLTQGLRVTLHFSAQELGL